MMFDAAILDFTQPLDRARALKALIESAGDQSLPVLLHAAENETDFTNLVHELELIGLCRDRTTAPFLVRHLSYPDPNVRAAAADALGILRQPSFQIEREGHMPQLRSIPPIDLGEPFKGYHAFLQSNRMIRGIPLDPSVQAALLKMMTCGVTVQEREAAARALVTWPPRRYHLRLAEWGVWMNQSGQLALTKSLIDEIPEFVHRTGNPSDQFQSYFLFPTFIFKPIVHLTVSTPMAVDIDVRIQSGRPWFAFPKPDDYSLTMVPADASQPSVIALSPAGPTSLPTTDVSNPRLNPLADTSDGYSWISPHHQLQWVPVSGSTAIGAIGVHWQSLIVSAERLQWMKPPAISSDIRFSWWSDLRKVPSSWVSSRNESERFLYYDGPTRRQVPVDVFLSRNGSVLGFGPVAIERSPAPASDAKSLQPKQPWEFQPEDPWEFKPIDSPANPAVPAREGLYIEFHHDRLQAQYFKVDSNSSVALQPNLPLQADAVVNRLREMLTSYGLTTPEANGLIAAWTPQFFQTEGRRFLLRMSPQDYASRCPMQVRPTPTEIVRLGLILTEFDIDGKTKVNSEPRGTDPLH
jgi:hypothetical protein